MTIRPIKLDLSINKTRKSIKEWLKDSTLEQKEWAINYLNSKGETIRNNKYEDLSTWADEIEDTAHNELLIRKMKSAWRQAKLRSKDKEKKSYSFILKTETKHQLDNLSRINKKTLSETIEDLITKASKRAQKADDKKNKTEPAPKELDLKISHPRTHEW